jgi:hypothetical protein
MIEGKNWREARGMYGRPVVRPMQTAVPATTGVARAAERIHHLLKAMIMMITTTTTTMMMMMMMVMTMRMMMMMVTVVMTVTLRADRRLREPLEVPVE